MQIHDSKFKLPPVVPIHRSGDSSVLGAIDHALRGINAGFERLDRAARSLAGIGPRHDPASNVVDMIRARHDVQANVAVARTADRMIGSVIDVLA
jgi:hypothetical protein